MERREERMSTDRPPSPKNLTTTINSNKLDSTKTLSCKTISPTTNMVLSAIPLDSGHVVIQQSGQRLPLVKSLMHQPLQQTQLNNILSSANFTSATTQIDRNTSPSKIINATNSNTITASSISTSSKYLLFHPNNTGHFNDFIGQSNGVGNIVIVATEQMDAAHPENSSIIHTNGSIINSTTGVSNNGSNTPPDEDLTSLTWLHDKNLIKGLVPCSTKNGSAARQINSNSLILTNTNAIAAVKSSSNDLIEDNTEEIEQHAINLKSQKVTNFSQQQHVQFPIINKNCSNILSPPVSTFQAMPTVAVSGSSAQLLQEHLNNNILGATTTVHIGPSGTTTVVEYKSNSGVLSSPNGITSSTITSSINSTSPSIVANGKIIQNIATTSSTGSLNNYSVASLQHHQQQQQQQQSTTHHPHKKYLREQMNGFDQSNVNKNNLSNLSTNNLNKNLNLNNNEQQYTQIIKSPNSANINSNQYSNLTVSQSSNKINQMEESPTNEYLLNTPSKSNQKLHQDQSLIIASDYDADSLKDFDISSANKQQQNYICSPNSAAGMSPSKQKHPTNVPYDPHVHTNSKPPYSFSSLIFMAIEDSPEKALPVKEIYAWIVHHFPYFKTAPTGWKNSVRHNLSLNKSFLKVEKAPNMGKGSLWRVEQMQRPNLMQALQRSPFFPCSAVDKFSTMLSQKNLMSPPQQAKIINNSNGNMNVNNISSLQSDSDDSNSYVPVKSNLDATLFPKLSKMMKEMVGKNGAEDEVDGPDGDDESSFGNNLSNNSLDYYSMTNGKPADKSNCADSIDDVNAATAMLALKHGSKVFAENFTNGSPVITNSPSDDHTYSAGNANTSHRESAPFTDGKSLNSSGSSTFNSQNVSSNSSNCASSDAAYESSSEESHNVTPEELEEKRRVEEGVDALLSLSLMFDKNSKPSTIKRTASTTVEEEHISSYMENIPHLNGKGSLASNLDEGYSTQSYYNNLIPTNTTLLSTTFSYPPKKLKQSKGLRAKIKRKTAWIR